MASDVNFLSPYDPNKELYLQTDGSKSGLGYLCYQEGDGPPPPPVPPKTETEEKKEIHQRSLGIRIIQVGLQGLLLGNEIGVSLKLSSLLSVGHWNIADNIA